MKRSILAIAALALAACSSFPAAADTVTATWDNPTQNTDGSAIPATGEGSLTSARLAWGSCNAAGGFDTEIGFIVRAQPVASVVFNLAPARWCIRVTVTNTYGATSDPSAVVQHVTPPSVPRAPTNFNVKVGP